MSQPSPNPHPTGMATSVIRISPSPSRTVAPSSTTQRVTWRIDSPSVTSPQNNCSRTTVMSSSGSHQQQGIILQKVIYLLFTFLNFFTKQQNTFFPAKKIKGKDFNFLY